MRSALGIGMGVLAALCITGRARADGLFYELPTDGSWVEYATELKTVKAGQERVVGTGTVTVSSVGSSTRDDQKCRWIEIAVKVTDERGRKINDVTKILVPEKHLTAGQNPAEHVLEAWAKHGDADGRRLDLAGKDAQAIRSMDEILRGPATDVEPLDQALVESKLGLLKCKGLRGTSTPSVYEVRLHAKAPFGVVTYRDEKFRGDASVRVTILTIADFGTNAKSLIREAS